MRNSSKNSSSLVNNIKVVLKRCVKIGLCVSLCNKSLSHLQRCSQQSNINKVIDPPQNKILLPKELWVQSSLGIAEPIASSTYIKKKHAPSSRYKFGGIRHPEKRPYRAKHVFFHHIALIKFCERLLQWPRTRMAIMSTSEISYCFRIRGIDTWFNDDLVGNFVSFNTC